MLLVKAIVFPSGDQAVPPIARVIYSFSIERLFSTWAFGLLEICLGSVTACGAGKACANVRVLIEINITNRISFSMGVLSI